MDMFEPCCVFCNCIDDVQSPEQGSNMLTNLRNAQTCFQPWEIVALNNEFKVKLISPKGLLVIFLPLFV